MKKIAAILFFILFYTLSIAQSCDIESGIKEIETLDKTGYFNEALSEIESLLACKTLTTTQKISLGIWQYKMYRNTLKPKKGKLTLLKIRSLLDENNISPSLELQLLTAESYALNKEYINCQKIIDELINQSNGDSLKKINNDSITKGRFVFINYLNIDRDAFPIEAIKKLHKSLAIFEKNENVPIYYLGNALRGLGNLYRTNGDYDKSNSYYQRELDLYTSNYKTDHFNIAIAHYNLGGIFYEKLEYQTAIDHYLKTYDVWVTIYEPTNGYMRNLNEAIGDLYWELGNKDKALQFFNYTIVGEKKINNDISEQSILQGDSLIKNGDYDIALKYYKEAFTWREKTYGKNHILTGACKNFVARAIRSSGSIEEALTAYQEAINILVDEMEEPSWYLNPTLDMKIQSHKYLLESLIAKGGLLIELYQNNKKLKDLETALQTYEVAILVLEKMKNNDMSESSKIFWTKRTLSLIENSIETALQLYAVSQNDRYLKKAFNFSERSKALLLLNSLNDQDIESFAHVSEEMISEEKKIKNTINEYLGRIESEEKRCSEVRDKMLELWRNKLQSLQNDYKLLLFELKDNYPDYYHLKYEQQIADLATIQKDIVDEHTVLIAFFNGDKKTYIFKITHNDISVRSLEDSSSLIQKSTLLFESLSEQRIFQDDPQKAFTEFTKISFQLYEKLLQPELITSDHNKLLIIPDGKLSYIPFEILLSQKITSEKRDYKNLPYLIKKYAVSYSPSVSIRLLSQKQSKYSDQYLGFAPNYSGENYTDTRKTVANLLYNKKEVEFATKLFKGRSWIGNGVTEDLLKKFSSQAGILHLAMHGEVEDKHPLLSKLYFNSSENEDGVLYTYEIYNLTIPAQLVILSACNTASGKLERGEGILSLERAFQYAGSKSLLSTLWTVDDESSSKLNQFFLENIKAGKSKDIALQEAKLQFLNTSSPDKLHPFYWSSFRLTGNTSPLIYKSNTKYYIIGFSIIAFILVVYLRRRQLMKTA